MLVALDRQLTHVEQNLSYYFSPNTHLTGEALALYVVGVALPELAASGRWIPQYYVELETIADRQKTTIQAIVNEIIVQYLESTSYEPIPISVDQKEDNPLLYLDGICKLEE